MRTSVMSHRRKTQVLLRPAVRRDQYVVNTPGLSIHFCCDLTGWLPYGFISYTLLSWLKTVFSGSTQKLVYKAKVAFTLYLLFMQLYSCL